MLKCLWFSSSSLADVLFCSCLTILFDNKVDARCLVEKCIVAMAKKHLDLKNVTWLFFPSFPCVTVFRVSLAVEELGLRVIPGMQGEVYSSLF